MHGPLNVKYRIYWENNLSVSSEVASKMNIKKSRILREDNMKVSVSEGAQHSFQVFKAVINAVLVCVWLAAPSIG